MNSFFLLIHISLGSLLVLNVHTCGITTHTEIAHRAASHFEYLLNASISIKHLIQKYQSSFQAGNPYPDSFYPSICKKGKYADVSEDTHWTPFLNATINHVRMKYAQNYENENALRLIVFLLGFTSHQIADITWHALGIDQGFLATMGFINFHGSFEDAHSVGDPGGDVVNQYELNTQYISDLGDWFIPYEDLYEIYLEYYGKEVVTKEDIIECSSLLFLGRLGEQLAFNLLYQDYSLKSTFLTNKLNDFFLGGLDDMATWTQLTWRKVLLMLENGTNACELDHNPLFITCDGLNYSNKRTVKNRVKSKELKLRDEWILDASYMQIKHEFNGVSFRPSEKFKKSLRNHKNIELKRNDSSEYFILNDYSQLGWQIKSADVNADGADDLIISAPTYSYENNYQAGQVYVKYGDASRGLPSDDNFNLDQVADLKINSPDSTSSTRFGHSLEVLDLNQDGLMDIVISAPSYNLSSLEYSGRVYVFFGNENGDAYKSVSITITCDNTKQGVATRYCNLGWSLSKGDVNGDGYDDLIVGSPYASTHTCGTQCGFVGVVLAKRSFAYSLMSLDDFDWILQGSMQYEWFGFSHGFGGGLLAISAPSSRLCADPASCSFSQNDTQAVGRVYLYKYPEIRPVSILKGTTQFELFGFSIDLSERQLHTANRTLLAISSPKYTVQSNAFLHGLKLNQGGLVQVFDVTEHIVGPISTFKSDRSYADFGALVAFKDFDADGVDDLLIGAPLRNKDLFTFNSNVEQGRVYVFKGGVDFPLGNVSDVCNDLLNVVPCPQEKAMRVFDSNEAQARFGQQVQVFKSKTSTQVGIGSARSDYGTQAARLSGKMFLFDL